MFRGSPHAGAMLVALALASPVGAQTATFASAVDERIRFTSAGQPLDAPARLHVADAFLSDALGRLARAADVALIYSPSLLPRIRVSCACERSTVRQALESLLDGTGFHYTLEKEQVVIGPVQSSRPAPPRTEDGAPPQAGAAEIESAPVGTITGRVVDAATRAPLPGAQLSIPGTGIGALADADGRYVLTNVAAGSVTLRVDLIGYRRAERAVAVVDGGTAVADFALAATAIELEEVVASVEAGAVRRKEVGTDIGSIPVSRELANASVTSFSDLLNARVNSVEISPASGMAGAGSRIRIRGARSLTQDNNPLLIIDGVRVTNSTDLGPISTGGQTGSRFDDINPDEIEDIQVIKGPSATALYGSEAAPGVLVITTKRGKAGQNQFSLQTRVGVAENPADFPDTYMDVTPFYHITELNDPRIAQFRKTQNPANGHIFVLDNPLKDPDSRPFRAGRTMSQDLSYSGGSEKVLYYTSLEYAKDQGTIPTNDLQRLNWRGNGLVHPAPNVDLSVSMGYINSKRTFPDDNSTGSGIGVGGMLGAPISSYGTDPVSGPGKGICLADALRGVPDGTTGTCKGRNGNFGTTFDKILSVDQGESLSRFTTSGSLAWRLKEKLTTSFTAGVDETNARVWDLTPFDITLPFGASSLGRIADSRSDNRIITADARATYATNLGPALSSTSSAGAQYFGTHRETVTCTGQDFPSDAVRACSAAQTSRGASSLLENVELGAFAQQRFGYRNYLFGTGAIRVDDNSSLGGRASAIWSPSFNASAVLSEMPFWHVRPVSNLRLRFAFGKASQSPGQYQADRTFQSAAVLLDGSLATGVTALAPGNDLLRPERSREIEAGVDFGLFQDRVQGAFTYFDSYTKDLIVPTPVPPSTGFPGLAYTNLGTMKSNGIEVNVGGALVQSENFGWDVQFRASTVHPLITDLGLSAPIVFPQGADGGSRAAGSQVFQTGFAPGAYISQVVAKAVRGPDGTITSFELAPGNLGDGSNRRVVGQPFPTNNQSLVNTFTFRRNTRLTVLFDRAAGHQILNVTEAFRTPFVDRPDASSYSRQYAFRQTLSPEKQAMIEKSMLAAFIEKGDFIKLREITLSQTLGRSLAGRIGASSAVLTVGGRNLATWTDFTGLDPEMNVRGARDDFISNNFAGSFPPSRTFWGGIRLTF
ncbi:MAG TPA: SusC/RagA family TonB-linked outer membrane protein [Longimicrobiales bacterium]|nr:SusC/RagA family TonB-linked outer membrane protein [Longimicrobiales bacterium]